MADLLVKLKGKKEMHRHGKQGHRYPGKSTGTLPGCAGMAPARPRRGWS